MVRSFLIFALAVLAVGGVAAFLWGPPLTGSVAGSPASPDLAMILLVLLAVASISLTLLFSSHRSVSVGWRSTRPERSTVWRFCIGQFLLLIPVLLVLVFFPNLHALLGIKFDFPIMLSFAVGLVSYLVFYALILLIQKATGTSDRARLLSFTVTRQIWPRQRHLKWLMLLAMCLFNPLTEEFLFRGVFVHLGGHYLGNFMLAAGIGLLLSVLAHLYQGFGAVPTQLLFHSIAIALVLSPFGLIGCVGFHLLGDLMPVLSFRKQWRKQARLAFANARTSAEASTIADARVDQETWLTESQLMEQDRWASEMVAPPRSR